MLIEQVVEIDRGEVLGIEISKRFVGTDRFDELRRGDASGTEFGLYLLRFACIVGGFGNAAEKFVVSFYRLNVFYLLRFGVGFGGVGFVKINHSEVVDVIDHDC